MIAAGAIAAEANIYGPPPGPAHDGVSGAIIGIATRSRNGGG